MDSHAPHLPLLVAFTLRAAGPKLHARLVRPGLRPWEREAAVAVAAEVEAAGDAEPGRTPVGKIETGHVFARKYVEQRTATGAVRAGWEGLALVGVPRHSDEDWDWGPIHAVLRELLEDLGGIVEDGGRFENKKFDGGNCFDVPEKEVWDRWEAKISPHLPAPAHPAHPRPRRPGLAAARRGLPTRFLPYMTAMVAVCVVGMWWLRPQEPLQEEGEGSESTGLWTLILGSGEKPPSGDPPPIDVADLVAAMGLAERGADETDGDLADRIARRLSRDLYGDEDHAAPQPDTPAISSADRALFPLRRAFLEAGSGEEPGTDRLRRLYRDGEFRPDGLLDDNALQKPLADLGAIGPRDPVPDEPETVRQIRSVLRLARAMPTAGIDVPRGKRGQTAGTILAFGHKLATARRTPPRPSPDAPEAPPPPADREGTGGRAVKKSPALLLPADKQAIEDFVAAYRECAGQLKWLDRPDSSRPVADHVVEAFPEGDGALRTLKGDELEQAGAGWLRDLLLALRRMGLQNERSVPTVDSPK